MPVTPAVQYLRFTTKRCFGVELEVNRNVPLAELVAAVRATDRRRACMGSTSYRQDSDNDFWHVKFDRSCGARANEGGWEVASYKASGIKDLTGIAAMGRALQQAGASVNNNCGYHVHVEIADFSRSQAATLVANWMRLERLIAEILPKGRRSNIYCKMLSDVKAVRHRDLADAETFWDCVRPTTGDNAERRVALNMCNYALSTPGKRTAELRLPEGTLEPAEIKNWARLFIHFVQSSKKAAFPKTVESVDSVRSAVTVLGLHGEDPFLLLSKGLYETKAWFLSRLLRHSSQESLRAEARAFLDFVLPPKTLVVDDPAKYARRLGWKSREVSADMSFWGYGD